MAETLRIPCGIAEPLLRWYDSSHRQLPWRTEPTPYRVWVSEIMLQQTRVEAVKPYFARFLAAFPDVSALAGAEEGTLLKCWEGLGYYSRARNLQKAARVITERFGGEIPGDPESLRTLPGIGSYTAGAIAAFAFNRPEPAVDGNVLRVLARLAADGTNVLEPRAKQAAETALRPQIPRERGGDFGQAMIELGAMVCVPGAPNCEKCPLEALCEARRQRLTAELPLRVKKGVRRIEERTVLLLLDDHRVAVRKRPDRGLLAGLYELPNELGHLTAEEAIAFVRDTVGLEPLRVEPLPPARHVFTHITWEMTGYRIRVAQMEGESAGAGFFFADRLAVQEQYAFPSAFEAYTRLIPPTPREGAAQTP